MGNASTPHARQRKPTLFIDELANAAEAVAKGSARSEDWDVVLAWVERDGIDCVAQGLEAASATRAPPREWWRGVLLLAVEAGLTAEQRAAVAGAAKGV
jgi:hypothetical protein